MLGCLDGWEHALAYNTMVAAAERGTQVVWWPGEELEGEVVVEGFFARLGRSPELAMRLCDPRQVVRGANLIGFAIAARAAFAESEAS